MEIRRYATGLLIATLSFLALPACSVLHQTKPVQPRQVQGAYTGAGGGFATGLAATSTIPIPIGMAVGSAFGLAAGDYNASVRGLTKQLQQEGAQVETIGDSVAVYIPSDLVFKSGTHEIKSSAYSVLTSVTAMAKLYVKSPGKIQVAGYTDNVMSRPENEKLSTQQAQSVVAYMWAEGIPHEVIAMEGMGERDPIANNVTSMGSAANRRIEVHFTTL